MSLLPDYVLSEAEDRARTRYITPSSISPWSNGVSMMDALGKRQCDELRRQGIDPATVNWAESVNWMWVTVPITQPFEFDRRAYGRAVQRIACPIIRTVGDRIQVVASNGTIRTVYAGGRLSKPASRRKMVGGWIGRG